MTGMSTGRRLLTILCGLVVGAMLAVPLLGLQDPYESIYVRTLYVVDKAYVPSPNVIRSELDADVVYAELQSLCAEREASVEVVGYGVFLITTKDGEYVLHDMYGSRSTFDYASYFTWRDGLAL